MAGGWPLRSPKPRRSYGSAASPHAGAVKRMQQYRPEPADGTSVQWTALYYTPQVTWSIDSEAAPQSVSRLVIRHFAKTALHRNFVFAPFTI
jgi:hypothetical protein